MISFGMILWSNVLFNFDKNLSYLGDTIKGDNESAELDALAENFREQAAKLVDMLDISIPVVAKLKVKTMKDTVTIIHKFHTTCLIVNSNCF